MKHSSLYSLFIIKACIAVAFLLTACKGEEHSTRELVAQTSVAMQVMRIDRPRHFRIILKEVVTGQVHEYSSRHCDKHHLYEAGGVYLFTVREYKITRPIATNDPDVKFKDNKEILIC